MVTIYGHARCMWCLKAKELADQYMLKYEWLDTDNPENLKYLKEAIPDVKTVPQIWWNGKHLGGYENFLTEIENAMGGYGDGDL
jgi:glutaredoxin